MCIRDRSSLGRKSVDGNITIPADYKAIGVWLKALFVAPTTSGSAAPYTHKFKISDNQPSFLVEKDVYKRQALLSRSAQTVIT